MNNGNLFDKYVFESGFTSAKDAIAHNANRFTCCLGRLFAGVSSISWRSIDRVQYLKQPILFITGTEDKTVPARMSKELQNAAINSPDTQLYEVEGAGHNRLYAHPGLKDYWGPIDEFLG